jgi:TPP-dependent pyruvate/acetoin dehydrogenase alpha subunit
MWICRQLDEIAFKLQRSGRMGTYPQNKGQEANAVGQRPSRCVKGTDWVVPCYRENARDVPARDADALRSCCTGWATSGATRSPRA